jgi:hypothetical protein
MLRVGVENKIVDATQKGGFDFLGYHFERGQKWPRKKSHQRLKESFEPIPDETTDKAWTASLARLTRSYRGLL